MTRESLWKVFCEKNPAFAKEGGEVTLSTKGLKKLFDTTWSEAKKESESQAEYEPDPQKPFDFGELLRGFKGKWKY